MGSNEMSNAIMPTPCSARATILVCIMYDLGYPTDACEVVKDLYTHATTRVHSAHGRTSPLPVDRGTIQGDSLSPLLFLLYLEPLLRWLKHGDAGYTPGIATDAATRAACRCAALAYADDLQLFTGCTSHMQHQIRKLELYSRWAHLPVNTD